MIKNRMLFKILWYDDIGRQRVIGRVLGAVQYVVIILTFLKVYGISLEIWQMILAAIVWFGIEVTAGWIYNRFSGVSVENDLYNEQNKLLQELRDKK